jgi:AcrR family transcriptional regulator
MTKKPQTTDTGKKPARASERIRHTARELFYNNGIRAVGVDVIVAEAGVTKPTLYRTFPSKDELAASYLRDHEVEVWACLDAAIAAHPGDPREQVLAYFKFVCENTQRSAQYRGCGLTNALVEFPEHDHPARQVAMAHKREFRRRFAELAREMGVRVPDALGDSLMLLLEGAYVAGQTFGEESPAARLCEAAAQLIDANLPSRKRPMHR